MKRLNKKGFTLVELLAVIVILALIMAIAIYSISGVLQSSRASTFKDTALSIIGGVRMQLLATNELREGDYYFTPKLLENDTQLPYGGKIKYASGTALTGKEIGSGVYLANAAANTECKKDSLSFVRVKLNGDKYEYSVCIGVDGTGNGLKWISCDAVAANTTNNTPAQLAATESNLMGNNNTMIRDYE